jgi:hypothetical protein
MMVMCYSSKMPLVGMAGRRYGKCRAGHVAWLKVDIRNMLVVGYIQLGVLAGELMGAS